MTVQIQILIEQIAALDDQRAFEKVFNLYYKKLKRFAGAIVKDPQLAEEVVCDVFIKVWNGRRKLLEVKNINSYFYIATKNMAITYVARVSGKEHVNLEHLEIDPVVLDRNPEEILLNSELVRCFDKAVRELPPKCQTIYRLAKQDGLRYREIAEILNLSIKTVDAQLALAVKKVAKAVHFFYNHS